MRSNATPVVGFADSRAHFYRDHARVLRQKRATATDALSNACSSSE
jgi:hypothetical protein